MEKKKTRPCRNCEEEFTVSRYWQLFCSERCKSHWHYTNKTTCFYCSDWANEKDHILPRKFTGLHYKKGETVPACRECNSMLHAHLFEDIDDAFTFLLEKYESRYKLHGGMPEWTAKELDELGPGLRSYVKKRIKEDAYADERWICLYMSRDYYRTITRVDGNLIIHEAD